MKKTILIIFGGNSNEHEVSLRSATTIISNIDKEKYRVLTIGITRDGRWLLFDGSIENIVTGEWEKLATPAIVSPDTQQKGILKLVGNTFKVIKVDVCFPVLHGKNGEDGTIQGLFELAGIPFVGAGTLSSAACMDKCVTKSVCKDNGIYQAEYLQYSKDDLSDFEEIHKSVKENLGFPCFVKPANAGSSVGITKAVNKKTLKAALDLAVSIDSKIVVEKAIVGRELECAVMGNDEPVASVVGEILPSGEFYDYDAKYNSEDSKTVIAPVLPDGISEEIRAVAIKVYNCMGCKGLARVDFFLANDGTVVFNEINTLPGFTSISMFPMLFQHEGMTVRAQIDNLISYALEG